MNDEVAEPNNSLPPGGTPNGTSKSIRLTNTPEWYASHKGRGFGTGAGAPSKFTPAAQAKIVEGVTIGCPYPTAAAYAGVAYRTFWGWMRRGEEEDEQGLDTDYTRFRARVIDAEAHAEAAIIAQWRAQIANDWRAARDFLARRYPDRWAARQKMELTGKDGGPVVLTLDLGTPTGAPKVIDGVVKSPPSSDDDEAADDLLDDA